AVRLRQFRQRRHSDRGHERADARAPRRDRAAGPARHRLGHLGERAFRVHDRAPQLRRSMRACAIFLCLALLGCAATIAPPGSESVTAHLQDGVLIARDGMRLPLREWDAETGAPKAVIIALHGMSDYSNAFDMPAKAWAKRGITTLAIDQRGFRRSENPGLWAGSDVMRADLADFAIAARKRFPDVKVYAAGESM